MSTLIVSVEDLRRVLFAVDTAATLDGELLTGPQEQSVLSLRRLMRGAGHLCLSRAVKDCPACNIDKQAAGMKQTLTCILNHTYTTRSEERSEKWWAKHEHPEVDDVIYDNNGDVKDVILR